MDFNRFIELQINQQNAHLHKLELTNNEKDEIFRSKLHLKHVMELDLQNTIAVACNKFINPIAKKKLFKCVCSHLPYDNHWINCQSLHDEAKKLPQL